MNEVKYVRTSNDDIVVFPASMEHAKFKHLNPVSAGFIQFYVENNKIKCECYGKSFSLDIEAKKEDNILADIQLTRNWI